MFQLEDHDWNDVMRGADRVAYVCAKCGTQLPALIVIGQAAVLEQLATAGRIPAGARREVSQWAPDGQAYAMDPRLGEFACTGRELGVDDG